MNRAFQVAGRTGIALLMGIGIGLSLLGTASAHSTHAKVLDSIPAINATITQAPTTITVHTAENINPNPQKSNLFVYGPAGDLISQGNAKVSLSNPKEMSINITPDAKNPNGIYIVRWITVSALDGDPDEGAFTFTVNPRVGQTSNQASTSGATEKSNPPNGVPLTLTIGIGVIALLLGLGAGLVTGRRVTRPKSALSSLRKEVAEQEGQHTPR